MVITPLRALLTTLMAATMIHHCSTYNNSKGCPQGASAFMQQLTVHVVFTLLCIAVISMMSTS